MKKVLSLAVLALVLAAGDAFATHCQTPPTGPHEGGGVTWWNYTPDPSCVHTDGSVSSGTLSCYGWSGYEYGMGWVNTVSYTFTIGPNDPVGATWSADAFIDFVDPNDSWWNQIEIYADVVHNGVNTHYSLVYHNGTMGDMNCSRPYGTFSATNGDTVTVTIKSTKWYSDTVIKSSVPNIFTY